MAETNSKAPIRRAGGARIEIGDEERGQLLAARIGIVSSLMAWGIGSLLLALRADVQSFALRGGHCSDGVLLTLLVGGTACIVLAVTLWIDSSPGRVESRWLRLQNRRS